MLFSSEEEDIMLLRKQVVRITSPIVNKHICTKQKVQEVSARCPVLHFAIIFY